MMEKVGKMMVMMVGCNTSLIPGGHLEHRIC